MPCWLNFASKEAKISSPYGFSPTLIFSMQISLGSQTSRLPEKNFGRHIRNTGTPNSRAAAAKSLYRPRRRICLLKIMSLLSSMIAPITLSSVHTLEISEDAYRYAICCSRTTFAISQ